VVEVALVTLNGGGPSVSVWIAAATATSLGVPAIPRRTPGIPGTPVAHDLRYEDLSSSARRAGRTRVAALLQTVADRPDLEPERTD